MDLTLIPLRDSFLEFLVMPRKVERFSDLITSGIPRLAMKWRMEFVNESVSILWATSQCMVLVAKHVNRTP